MGLSGCRSGIERQGGEPGEVHYSPYLYNFVHYFPQDGCIDPTINNVIERDSVICQGTYNVTGGLIIFRDNITLDCNGSTLISTEFEEGSSYSFGIFSNGKSNITVKNRNFVEVDAGIYSYGHNNHFVSNKINCTD